MSHHAAPRPVPSHRTAGGHWPRSCSWHPPHPPPARGSALVSPDNSLSFSFLRDDRPVFNLGVGGWGPKWAWVGISAQKKADGERLSVRAPFVVNKDKGEVIDLQFEAWQPTPRQVAFRYDLESAKDVPLTMLMAAVNFEGQQSKGTLTLTHADGKETKMPLPIRGIRSAPATAQADFAFDKGGTVTMRLTRRAPSGSTTACA